MDWEDVFDEHLEAWRNADTKAGNLERTTNIKLLTIYAFYMWAQKEGLIHEVIGEPSIKRKNSFQIKITISKKRGRTKSIGSDLLYRDLTRPMKPVPTQRDMDSAYVELAKSGDVEKVERDILLLRWGSEVGLRRAEIQQLELAQIPTIEEAEELLERGEVKSMRVVGKGNKARLVPVNPELFLATAEYIRYQRAFTLAKLRNPRRSNHVFISTTTGRTLSLKRISDIGSKALKVSNPELTFHRTRARYASRFCQVCFQEEFDRKGHLNDLALSGLVLQLKNNLGHSDPKAWEAYVQLELKMFVQANPSA